jgi:hypothetical protein
MIAPPLLTNTAWKGAVGGSETVKRQDPEAWPDGGLNSLNALVLDGIN